LARMKFFHDANIIPPMGWVPRSQRLENVRLPPLRATWFSPAEEETKPEPLVKEVKRAAAIYFELTPTELDAQRRTAEVVYPRQIAMYLSKTLTKRSLPEIGKLFGGRDHTTVLHNVRKIKNLVKTDWKVAYDVAHVEALL
jgi:chromosomal replication initiation ATPase DnaA